MRGLLFILFFAFMSMGCNPQITDYVTGGAKRILPSIGDTPGAPVIDHQMRAETKISPGANVVSGGGLQSRFAITPTDRVVSGGGIQSRFSLHHSHPK